MRVGVCIPFGMRRGFCVPIGRRIGVCVPIGMRIGVCVPFGSIRVAMRHIVGFRRINATKPAMMFVMRVHVSVGTPMPKEGYFLKYY